jgi:hypothetical protein
VQPRPQPLTPAVPLATALATALAAAEGPLPVLTKDGCEPTHHPTPGRFPLISPLFQAREIPILLQHDSLPKMRLQ